jgi:hypothetical protein
MIARATQGRQFLENPTKNRVTACRKRLRSRRGRRHDLELPVEQSSTMGQFPADSLQVRQLVSLEMSPLSEHERVVEQEVGIT